jgi:hypothetical protein
MLVRNASQRRQAIRNLFVASRRTSRMASFSFKTLNIISLLLALSIFGITVAAACVTWYSSNDTYNQVTSASVVSQSNPKTVLNSTSYLYSLQGITTKTISNQRVETNSFNFYVDASARFSIVKLSQAFTLIALIVSALLTIVLTLNFFSSFRDKLIFTIGATVLRNIIVVSGILIVISVVIAFLAWTGITQAFASDIPNCITGPCLKFVDSETSSTANTAGVVTRDVSWGPAAGWYLVLACIPVSIIFTIVVTLNKYPIPIDSIGTGEAL